MRRSLQLSPRLRLLAEWVPLNTDFADVGTDHAYLPVWLVLHGRVKRCIASDLRPRPLQRAKETAKIWNADGISFRLCDGLSGIRPEEVQTIVIAGLGGENIAAILEKAPWTADGNHTLLLQPATRAEVLRRYLAEHGYTIRREALVLEHDKLYPVMEAVQGQESLSAGQCYGGAKLTCDPLGNRYLIEKILRLQNAVAGLHHARKQDICTEERQDMRLEELRDILTELYAMREEWRHENCPGN